MSSFPKYRCFDKNPIKERRRLYGVWNDMLGEHVIDDVDDASCLYKKITSHDLNRTEDAVVRFKEDPYRERQYLRKKKYNKKKIKRCKCKK